MPEGSLSVDVSRPPEAIWPVLSDLEQAPRWVPDLVSVTKLTEGPIAVGTRYSEVVKMGKKESEAFLEVTEFEPPHVFAHSGRGGPSRFAARFTLEPIDGGTRVTHAYTITMKGLWKLFTPLMKSWIRKNAETTMASMKRALEESGD